MPIDPGMAEQLAKEAAQVYRDAEYTMLVKVARRLGRGITTDGWADTKLAEVQRMRGEIEAEIERLTDQGAEAADDAVRKAYNRGVASAGTELEALGESRAVAFGAVDDLGRVGRLIAEATDTLQATHLRILRSTMDVYRQTVAEASAQVMTGTVTRREAAQRVLDDFARRGVTGFVDSRGRAWDLGSYAEMAVRSATGGAAVQGHLDRVQQSGRDLVQVSDAPQECELCRPWEGKVLSISGNTSGTVELESAVDDSMVTVDVAGSVTAARMARLFHPNCRHSMRTYLPGATPTFGNTADPEGDEARQELRRLERGTRQWKRREAVALSDEAATKARSHTRQWQGRIREHTATSPAKRIRAREQIGSAR